MRLWRHQERSRHEQPTSSRPIYHSVDAGEDTTTTELYVCRQTSSNFRLSDTLSSIAFCLEAGAVFLTTRRPALRAVLRLNNTIITNGRPGASNRLRLLQTPQTLDNVQ